MAEKSQKEYMKEMKKTKRAAYIWYYYKWFILLAIGLAIVFISLGVYAYRTPTDYMAEVVLVNADTIETDKSTYFDDFITEMGYEEGYDYLLVDTSMQLDLDEANSSNSSTYQVLAAMFLTGEIDVYVSEPQLFDMMAANEGFRDLREVLPEDILEKYADKLYYCEDAETGESVPVGIMLDESALYTEETIFNDEAPIAGVGSQSGKLEIDADLLLYFLGESK